MQEQQNIQNVKTWQAPELSEVGAIASETQGGIGGADDGAFNTATS
jgi:hypothetical protein